LPEFFSIFIPIIITIIIQIPNSGWHKTPEVKYARFKAPIVVIGSLIWVEIRTQNNSTSFMRVHVADKAMADMNWRRISGTLPDQQSKAKA
jgi:hypothetical protein